MVSPSVTMETGIKVLFNTINYKYTEAVVAASEDSYAKLMDS